MSSYKKVKENGTICYYKIGTTELIHRLDGPAVIYTNGDYSWYKDGKLHRLDGPALKWDNGNVEWYAQGNVQWWYNGKHIDCKDQETFERLLKLKAFW